MCKNDPRQVIRVVHGSHFRLIFDFIFNLIFYLKFKNVMANEAKNDMFSQNGPLPPLLQNTTFLRSLFAPIF
jgi:hypothetical protein